jgi:hypothetical protein
MRRFFAFWWLCAREAAQGNSAFANDWQWLLGYPLIAAGIWVLGYFYAEFSGRVEVTLATGALGALAAAGLAFFVTWSVAFAVRLLNVPVALFHEQKDRADKLGGVVSDANVLKRRKPIAALVARYITNKAPIQRQALDHEADSLQAMQDVQIIFNGVTAETIEMTKLMTRSNKKINSAKDPQKKRQVVKNLADHFNSYSDRVEEFAAIIRGMTPVLLECTGSFLERTAPNVDRATLDTFIAAVDGAVESISGNIESASGAVGSISANFRGVTHDLNSATSRLESVMEAYRASLNEYKSACEHIRTLANEGFDDGKAKLIQETI